MTDQERQEVADLLRQLQGMRVKVHLGGGGLKAMSPETGLDPDARPVLLVLQSYYERDPEAVAELVRNFG